MMAERGGADEAVTYRGGHLQIIACAGAGKTEAISRRVADILADGTPPGGIIAFTFTEKAGKELKARIERKVLERPELGARFLDLLAPMFVGTIHSYCMRVLQQHVPRLADFDVVDDHKLMALLSREYNRLKLGELSDGHHGANIELFKRSADVVDNEMIALESLGDSCFRESYELYLDMLERYHVLTYGQMISRAVQVLEEEPEIRGRVLAPLRHLIVDEYQDTNAAQERLVEALTTGTAHVCVVGDDDQAIYQWRGATVDNILTFADRYADGDIPPYSVELPRNRRSQPCIVETAQRFIEAFVDDRLPKAMAADRSDEGGAICAWVAETAQDEAEVLAETVVRLHQKGFAWRDMAVLLRSVKTSSRPIIEALETHDVPVRCGGSSGLFMERDAQLLARLYAWLSESKWKADRWSGAYEEVTLEGLLASFKSFYAIDKRTVEKLERHLEDWKAKSQDDHADANLVGDFYGLLQLLKLREWDAGDDLVATRLGSLARFSNLLADFEHGTKRARRHPEDGGVHGGLQGGPWLYKRFLWYMQYYALTSYEGFSGEETLDYDAVEVATVHTAKGLQWPVVFVPALTEDRFPSSMTGRAQGYLVSDELFDRGRYEGTDVDEARLFYVAMTRARDALYVSRFSRVNRSRNPSIFYAFAAQYLGEVEAPLPLPELPLQRPNSGDDLPVVTFSELAAYDRCPFGYRLRSLLGFQPPFAREMGYGRAVHHILRRVAEETQKQGAVPPEQTIDRIFDEEFFLPFANQPAFKQMRAEAKRLVGTFLDDHGEDFTRIWQTERPFELHLPTAVVAGRADVILDGEDGHADAMAILDYKTAIDEDPTVHNLQLQIYTSAGRREGLDVRAAYVMDLKQGEAVTVDVGETAISAAEEWAGRTVQLLAGAEFDASPSHKCAHCDVSRICRHGD